jgi:heptosyltransferase I
VEESQRSAITDSVPNPSLPERIASLGDTPRILIIKPSSLGDVVHALPVLHLLRRRFPRGHIAWLVAPYCAGLIEGLPDLNETILFDRRRLGRAWRSPAALRDLLALKRKLRSSRFDLVLDLQGLLRSAWLTWQTRAPLRVGFANARELAPLAYTHRVPIETMEQHAVDRYLKTLAATGLPTAPVEFHFPVTDAARAAIDEMIPPGTRYAVLMPGTNWATKRWPAERFGQLVQPLRDRHGLTSVIAGGPDAAALAHQIPGATNLAGKTNLPQLVALLERAEIVIANDSGPLHIAAALGKPLVALFGPTNPVRTGPYQHNDGVVHLDIPCSPCYSRTCSHTSCLNWLQPDPVLQTVKVQLNHPSRRTVAPPRPTTEHAHPPAAG